MSRLRILLLAPDANPESITGPLLSFCQADALARIHDVTLVIGPVNGGLPFPPGFNQADNQKEWVSGLRSLYRFLPFARATYGNAAAIVAGSSHTYAQFASHRDKLFFLPENGVTRSLCSDTVRSPERDGRIELIFVGSLVPFKACDLGLRAAAHLLTS